MYLRHQTYTLYYRDVCILVFLHVFAYFMLLRCMLKFKRLACGSDDVTQYNTIQSKSFNCLQFESWSTIYSYFDFGLKNSSFRLPYQRSSADCAKELFKGSNGSANLVDCTRKNFLVGGCRFFVSDVISEVVLGSCCLA